MMIKKFLIVVVALTQAASSSTLIYEPSLYFSERDSPFYGGIIDNTGEGIWLETFEDQELNTPNVTTPVSNSFQGSTYRARTSNPGALSIWGVDGDDGQIDGMGFGGDVWINTRTGGGSSQFMEFNFQPDSEGRLPRYVGLVITRPISNQGQMEVGWVDGNGEFIYDTEYNLRQWNRDPVTGELYEGLFGGDPRLMRFVGLFHDEGISKISLNGVSQVDHLQYGFSIPEPSSGILLFWASLMILGRKRRG